jgi:hypothetical protein
VTRPFRVHTSIVVKSTGAPTQIAGQDNWEDQGEQTSDGAVPSACGQVLAIPDAAIGDAGTDLAKEGGRVLRGKPAPSLTHSAEEYFPLPQYVGPRNRLLQACYLLPIEFLRR